MKNMELQAARTGSGKTQRQVAEKIGKSETAYQNYELGKRKPSAETAIDIATEIGIKDFEHFRRVFGKQQSSPGVCGDME